MADQFREAEATFSLLREKFKDKRISPQEFADSLKQLRIKDEEGRFWVIGAQSGKWYAFENGEWIEAKPPSQMEKKAICIACGFENDLEAETCARCGSRGEGSEPEALAGGDGPRSAAGAEAVAPTPGSPVVAGRRSRQWRLRSALIADRSRLEELRSAAGLGLRLVHAQRSTAEVATVEGGDRRGGVRRVHLDEAEAARAARLPVHHHRCRAHLAVLREQLAQVRVGSGKGKVSNIDLLQERTPGFEPGSSPL